MKKIVSVICAAAMAGAMFAEVNVGAWGRSGMELTNTTDFKENSVVATPGWAGGSRVGVNFGAASEDGTIGFNLNVDSNGGAIGIGDQAKIWANVGPVQVQFGKIQMDDLRGSIGDWGSREEMPVAGEDAIFARFNPQNGMAVALRTNGVFIGATIDPDTVAGLAYSKAQVGLGYTVEDIVQLKAQYLGAPADLGDFQIGADILCLPVLVEVGCKLSNLKDSINVNAVVGVNGGFDALALKAHAVFGYTGSVSAAGDLAIEYALDPCTIGCNVGYSYNGDNTVGGEVYAKKAFGNGYLFGGVADTFTTNGNVNTFKVPVGAEYWF